MDNHHQRGKPDSLDNLGSSFPCLNIAVVEVKSIKIGQCMKI